MTAIYVNGKKKAEYETIHEGAFNKYILKVDRSVKTRNNEEIFKSIDTMYKHLDKLFGNDWGEE